MGDARVPRLRKRLAETEKLKQLDFTAGFSFVSYGVRIRISCNSEEALDQIRTCLPPGWRPTSSSVVDHTCYVRIGGAGKRPGLRHYHLLAADDRVALRTLELDELLHRLEKELYSWVVTDTKERIFVHAGVVAYDGRALILPGRTHAGKTTLVRALLKAGATYYSDEAAVLDEVGRVHPYARMLAVREGSEEELPRRYAATAMGVDVGHEPLPVGAIIFSQFRRGAIWKPRRLSPGTALLKLLSHTLSPRTRPEMALNALGRIVVEAPVYQSLRPDAETVADQILAYLDH